MSFVTKTAYDDGRRHALAAYGLTKEAINWGAIGQGVKKFLPTALKGVKALAGNIPGVGIITGGLLGAAQGLAQGEGGKGALVRGGIGAAAGLASSPGLGMAASIGGDMVADKIMAPRGPQPQHLPGMMGSGAHLPGQAI